MCDERRTYAGSGGRPKGHRLLLMGPVVRVEKGDVDESGTTGCNREAVKARI